MIGRIVGLRAFFKQISRLSSASTCMKRPLSVVQDEVTSLQASKPLKELRIVSWNIESPNVYLQNVKTSLSSQDISSYFTESLVKREARQSSVKGKGRADQASPQSPSLREVFRDHGFPDIVALQEVRALAHDKAAIRALRNAANQPIGDNDRNKRRRRSISSSSSDASSNDVTETESPSSLLDDGGPSYTAHFSLCQSKKGSGRFGVAVYVSSTLARHAQYTAREVNWDAEGRVVFLTFPSLGLAVISVYALNGSSYPWRDPVTNVERGTRNDRKREFNRLLAEECRKLQQLFLKERNICMQLVMVGDWNVSREIRDCFPRLRTEEPHAISRRMFNDEFMPSIDVVDAFRELHGDKRSFSVSKVRACNAIPVDCFLCSSGSHAISLIGQTWLGWIMPWCPEICWTRSGSQR